MELRDLDLPADEPMLVAGIRDFISRMDYKEILPTSDEEIVNSIKSLLHMGVVEILVVEYEDRLVGGIGMVFSSSLWNSQLLNGEELFFWTAPDAPASAALRLIRGARSRAQERGCQHLVFKSMTSSPEKLERVYARFNLRPVEISYMGPC